MRTLRLLLVVLLVLGMAGIAVGQESKTDSQKPNAQQNRVNPPDSAKPLNPFQDGQTFTYRGMPFHFDKKNLRLVPDFNSQDALNGVTNDCLVMHTIRVPRSETYTESNHILSVTECTPAKRFEMKSAVDTPLQK